MTIDAAKRPTEVMALTTAPSAGVFESVAAASLVIPTLSTLLPVVSDTSPEYVSEAPALRLTNTVSPSAEVASALLY